MKTFKIYAHQTVNDLQFGKVVKVMLESDEIHTQLKDDTPIQQRYLHSIAIAYQPEKVKYL